MSKAITEEDKRFARALYYLVWIKKKKSQEAIVKETDIPQSTVSAVMNGKRRASPERQDKIAKCFNKTIEEFKLISEENGFKHPKIDFNIIEDKAKECSKNESNGLRFSFSKKDFLSALEDVFSSREIQSSLIEKCKQTSSDNGSNITTERHRKVINKFKNKDLALKLNELLLEIEQINPEVFKEAETTLSLLKIKAEQESDKKRTANGNE